MLKRHGILRPALEKEGVILYDSLGSINLAQGGDQAVIRTRRPLRIAGLH